MNEYQSPDSQISEYDTGFVSHRCYTEGSLSLNYSSLPHGQYVVYIRNGINVFA